MTHIKERRPGLTDGSIHCPVRAMKHNIEQLRQGYPEGVVTMIKQLRTAWADPQYSDWDRAGFLWLARRYQKAYAEVTGAPLPK